MLTKETPKAEVRELLENIDLTKALDFNRFYDFLKETKKYKDLYWSKESFFAVVISIVITLLMSLTITEDAKGTLDVKGTLEISASLISVFIGGLCTVLGLSLAGLAIVTSTMTENFISIIVRRSKLYSLLGIIFNFYFSGFIIGVTIFLLTLSLIILKIPSDFNIVLFVILVFVNSFFVFFSLIYATMLLGTCIRLFITKYAIEINENAK